MNLKRTLPKIVAISMLASAFAYVAVMAQPLPPGPWVDEHYWDVTISNDARLTNLLQHVVEADGVPRPVDIPTLMDNDFLINSEAGIGYGLFMMNNRLYPCDNGAFREACHLLIDKERIIEELFTVYVGPPGEEVPIKTLEAATHWVPKGQAAWVNWDYPLPTYDPDEADAVLAAGGFIDSDNDGILNMPPGDGTTPNMPTIEYITISEGESPLAYEMAVLINAELNDHGIPTELLALDFTPMVIILIFPPLDDWQIMSGIGISWTVHETVCYDFFESTQEPLWNCWGVQDTQMAVDTPEIMDWVNNFGKHTPATGESRLDWWCHEMKLTLDTEWLDYCTLQVQPIADEYLPYVPLTTGLAYTTFSGDHAGGPGVIGVVNAAGYGGLASYNRLKMQFTRSETAGGVITDPRTWTLPTYITSLNGMVANTVYDYQVLDYVTGLDLDLSPYYQGYIWWLNDGAPTSTASTYQVGMEKEHPANSTVSSSGWTGPDEAYKSDDVYASATADTSNVVYDDFDFPAGFDQVPLWHVSNVEVGIEGYATAGDDLEIEVSWDSGTSWTTTAVHSPPVSDTMVYTDVTDGREWTWEELSNPNLLVKITKAGIAGTVYMDLVTVKVKIAPDGFNFGDYATGMYVDYDLRPGLTWHDGTPLEAEAVRFGLNLMRYQDNIRYRSYYQPIYKIEVLDTDSLRIWYLNIFIYHFETIGNWMYAPKHIWEGYIQPLRESFYEPFQPSPTVEENYNFWYDWERHHSEYRPWENILYDDQDPPQPVAIPGYEGEVFSELIGLGPFYFPHGTGWVQGSYARLLANRDWFGSHICRADVDLNGIADTRDVYQVLIRQGATFQQVPGTMPPDVWNTEVINMQGAAADIAPPCQFIGAEEIALLQYHFGDKWLDFGVPQYPVLPGPCD